MARLTLTAADVAGVRLAFSPLWEVVASVRVLKSPGTHALHLPWIKAARRKLTEAGPLDLLWALVPVPARVLPSFLAPTPATPLPELADELAELVAVPTRDLRAELEEMAPHEALDALHRSPARGLKRLAGEVRRYWDTVLADDWPRLRGLLEGDVMYRARRLALGGAKQLFADLHPMVGWAGDTLAVDIAGATAEHQLDGRGLVLVPSAFVWPRVFLKVDPRWPPVLRYPPRGVATLWDAGSPAGDGLAGVLGRSRAWLLAELASPASTSELARRTGLTPAGVSQHLARLRDAGLVTSHRAGPVVLYARTRLADDLAGANVP